MLSLSLIILSWSLSPSLFHLFFLPAQPPLTMVNPIIALSLASTLLTSVIASPTADHFNPYSYKKNYVTCNAVDRSGPKPMNIKLKLAYIDINPTAKKTLVMVHGWPSLWTTYRNQIEAFGKEYRIILPEHRGFGDSEHPKDLKKSNAMFDVSSSYHHFSPPTVPSF
jgi:soluble epoxide hydrolase/lipid-phosphate phosphatase